MKKKPIRERSAKSHANIHSHPLLNRIYQNRGLAGPQELDYSLKNLLPPSTMKGMDEATDVIIRNILAGSYFKIAGDYDCDGATSSAIAVQGLEMLGAKKVEICIPDRVVHGYGLSPKVVELAAQDRPDIIITVDNGISSIDGAEAVQQLPYACDLVITDHHLPPEQGFPKADAVVNPNQDGCPFASKSIAGCGVIFYVIMATRAKMREQGLFKKLGIKEPDLKHLLDLVALGTVADVVPLDYNNRILVANGIAGMNSGKYVRPGIKAIFETNNREMKDIVPSDMGFLLGPRLNAAGRLDDMSKGVRLLLEKDFNEAKRKAEELNQFNKRRKEIELEMMDTFKPLIENFESDKYGVCVYDPTGHEGVIGIVASRVKDKLNRPTICFSDTHEAAAMREKMREAEIMGDEKEVARIKELFLETDVKGSARSVPGVHLKHTLDEIKVKHPHILSKAGGHSMAAGLSLRHRYFEEFQNIFDSLVRKHLTPEMIKGEVLVDVADFPAEWMTLENAQVLRKAGPWGQHFEQPLFSKRMEVIDFRPLKGGHLKLKLRAPGTSVVVDGICFKCLEDGEEKDLSLDFVDVCFSLDVNEYRGRISLQLMIDHIEKSEMALNNTNEGAVKVGYLGASKQQQQAQKNLTANEELSR